MSNENRGICQISSSYCNTASKMLFSRTLSNRNDSLSQMVELINIRLVHVDSATDTPLGVVIVEQRSWPSICLPGLRDTMKEQLHHTLPEKFQFCTSARYPIAFSQEQDIKAVQICDNCKISITVAYGRPKIVIKDELQVRRYGFVHCNYTDTLSIVRGEIASCIPELESDTLTYQILCCDKSPVPFAKESEMSVIEALYGGCINLRRVTRTDDSVVFQTLPSRRKALGSLEHSRVKNLRLSFSSSKDASRQGSTDQTAMTQDVTQVGKQLLISYVRAEAAEHALNLKKYLTDLGFSVYLDVHEIKSGLDWQDSLNYAVSNCEVFVPLVTPRYGETQWTNREVKLADVLGKAILPVSFLQEWPPRCLAIQFATTQYISWKTPQYIQDEILSGKGSQAYDIRHWDRTCIEYVSRELARRIKTYKCSLAVLSKPALSRLKTLMKTFAGRLPEAANPVLNGNDSDDSLGGPQIVICLHPDQSLFGQQLKSWLEEASYSVWISSNDKSDPHWGENDVVTPTHDEIQYAQTLKKGSTLTFEPQCNLHSDPTGCHSDFQEATDRASLVIIVLSKIFIKSRTCRQQVFYCEQRKQILPLKYEDVNIPSWLSMLIRTKHMENVNRNQFKDTIMCRVQRLLDPTGKKSLDFESHEAKIDLAISHLRKSIPAENCVYVTGTHDIDDARTEAICRAIGKQLAQMEDILIVTGGTFGVGDVVGRTVHEETQRQFKPSIVWHMLPEMESTNVTAEYNQNPDGSFPLIGYGRTLFCGNSVLEKETIIGRCFRICLLIDGSGCSSHQVEEFVWSDHIVVPVCTSEDSHSCFPDKISQLPPGVNIEDWKILREKGGKHTVVAAAVVRVLSSLFRQLDGLKDGKRGSLSKTYSVSSSSAPLDGHAVSKPVMSTRCQSVSSMSVDIDSTDSIQELNSQKSYDVFDSQDKGEKKSS